MAKRTKRDSEPNRSNVLVEVNVGSLNNGDDVMDQVHMQNAEQPGESQKNSHDSNSVVENATDSSEIDRNSDDSLVFNLYASETELDSSLSSNTSGKWRPLFLFVIFLSYKMDMES